MACVIFNCKSHSSRKSHVSGLLSFHRFPDDERTKQKWMNIVTMTKNKWKWSKHSRICSKHFTDDCFVMKGHRWSRIKMHEVPTINLNCDSPSSISSVLPPPPVPLVDVNQAAKNTRDPNNQTDHNYTPSSDVSAKETSRLTTDNLLEKIKHLDHQLQLIPPVDANQTVRNTSALKHRTDLDYTPLTLTCVSDDKTSRLTIDNLLEKNKHLDHQLQLASINEQKLEKCLQKAQSVSEERLRKINTLLQRTRRSNNRNLNLHVVLNDLLLKESEANSEHNMMLLNCIKNNKIVERYLSKLAGADIPKEYELELKRFAIALHTVSPRAYDLVRNEFGDALPHPNTISKWH